MDMYHLYSGALRLRHGIHFSRKTYACGGHMTTFYVNGWGITYLHYDTKSSIEFAEVKNDEKNWRSGIRGCSLGELTQTRRKNASFCTRRHYRYIVHKTVRCYI